MISVIIAAYNYGKYISEAFTSLQNQTYTDWECIVIDDGSNDNTKEVVTAWIKKDQRIKYFLQENAGPSAARNNGINKSSGSFILFLDADDILEVNKLQSHLAILENNQTIDIAYGDVRYFTDAAKLDLFYSLHENIKSPWIPRYNGKGKGLINLVLKQNIMVTSSPLFRKKVFEIIGGFDEKLLKLEDWELFQRMALHNLTFQFVDAPKSMVLMRAHSASYSIDKRGMRSYFLPILEKLFFSSKLSSKNRIYVSLRMLEEYTDILFAYLFNNKYPPIHYYWAFILLLPVFMILLFPFYMIIKIQRLLKQKLSYKR